MSNVYCNVSSINMCSCSDPGDQNRDRGQQRNTLCQGCPAALVPDEDCRVGNDIPIQKSVDNDSEFHDYICNAPGLYIRVVACWLFSFIYI